MTRVKSKVTRRWLLPIIVGGAIAIVAGTAAGYATIAGGGGRSVATAGVHSDGLTTSATGNGRLALADDLLDFNQAPTISISGTPKVGEEVTATESAGAWDPTPESVTYQWFSGDLAIDGATDETYTVQSTDFGPPLTVAETGHSTGYNDATTTSDSVIVQAGDLTTQPVTITGTPTYGEQLTANTDPWGPGDVTLSYDWLRDGASISGSGPSSTYTLVADDINHAISVTVTGSEDGYATQSVTSDPTSSVNSLALDPPPVPKLSSTTPTFGQTLTVDAGTWTPGDVTKSYEWLRDGSSFGAADQDTYQLVADDIGHHISVRVTGSETGYASLQTTTDPTDPVAALTFDAPPTPTIDPDPTPTFGDTLTASTDPWGPGDVTLSYEWLRDGESFGAADQNTYQLVSDDIGHQISVQVTGIELGYTTETSAESTPTDVVIAASFGGTLGATITGPSSGLHVYKVTPNSTLDPEPDSYLYQWEFDGSPITGATGSTFLPTGDQVDPDGVKQLTALVTPVEDGYSWPTPVESNALEPTVAHFQVPTDPPTITGFAQVGQTLTVDPGTWLPETPPNGFTYLWKQGTCATDEVDPQVGASATYVVQPTDVNLHLCVTVSGTGANYVSGSSFPAVTASVASAPLTVGTVSIASDAQVGRPLTAVTSGWGPGTVNFTYIWYRNANPISGASSSTYTPGSTDVGATIHVSVVGTEAGYSDSVPVSSGSTTAVTKAGFGGTQSVAISGVPSVGRTLTETTTSDLTPTPASTVIQWMRNGSPISGANKSTYLLTAPQDIGPISVRVTSSASGYQDVVTTSDSVTVTGAFKTVPTPTISGTARLGTTLTANAGAWDPSPLALDYTWRNNGLVVQDGASHTYLPTADDVGFPITVTVTGTAANTAPASATSLPTAKVAAGILTLSATPTISGTTKTTGTLTANVGTWSQTLDSVSYQWLLSGKAISGATSQSYPLIAADYKKTLSVTVTGHLRGYTSLAKTSKATAAIAAGPLTTALPTIAASPPVGTPITVGHTGWGPGTVKFSYQWYLGSSAISKATASTYTPTASAVGKLISVRIKGSETGYATSGTMASAQSTVVAGTFTTATPTISGTVAVGSTLTAAHSGWAPTSGVTFHYQWYSQSVPADPSPIVNATKSTYLLAAGDAGKLISVKVWASLSGFTTSAEVWSAPTSGVLDKLTTATPTITGAAKVGQPLTVRTGTWHGSGTDSVSEYSYQWYYVSGSTSKAISGATSSTYVVASAYKGKTIKVAVTAVIDGYAQATVYSKVTAKIS